MPLDAETAASGANSLQGTYTHAALRFEHSSHTDSACAPHKKMHVTCAANPHPLQLATPGRNELTKTAHSNY